MPIYEYECPTHGRFEVHQRISEDALKSCTIDNCAQPVRKLISSTSFALKGGGWYSDGYGSSSGGGSSSSGGGKSEATPASSTPVSAGTETSGPMATA